MAKLRIVTLRNPKRLQQISTVELYDHNNPWYPMGTNILFRIWMVLAEQTRKWKKSIWLTVFDGIVISHILKLIEYSFFFSFS